MDVGDILVEFRRTGGRAGEDEPQPDVVEYAITADGHTVRAVGSALPAELMPLVEALNVVLLRDTSGR